MTKLQVINGMLHVAEHGCKWRGLPKKFGNWHTIYTRMRRWTKAGILDRIFVKGYRRIFSRFEKLEAMFVGFLSFVLVADGLRVLC